MSKTLTLPELSKRLAAMQADICKKFAELQKKGEELKQIIPTFTLPWNTYTPPVDQRHYQIENCMDAILKVLPSKEKDAITSGEIIRRIQQDLKLSYAHNTISQTLSNMRRYHSINGYRVQRETSVFDARVNRRGRPGQLFWAIKD